MAVADVNGIPEQPDSTQQSTSRDKRATFALAALILFTLLVCCWLFITQTAVVPDVTGMTFGQARATLKDAGFGFRIDDASSAGESDAEAGSDDDSDDAADETDDDGWSGYPDDAVVSKQSPRAGRRALKGTRVVLTLSGGRVKSDDSDSSDSDSYTTPDSDGRDSDADDDFVAVAPPASGAADRRPFIPLVGNIGEASAVAKLQGAGYRVTVKYGPSSAGVIEGNVYAQEPAFGSQADRGTLVTLWISTGAPHEDGYEGVPYAGPGH